VLRPVFAERFLFLLLGASGLLLIISISFKEV